MKLNKRALLVEGVIAWVIGTGMAGVHLKLNYYKVGSFFVGIFLFTVIAFACVVLYSASKDLFLWINEEGQD